MLKKIVLAAAAAVALSAAATPAFADHNYDDVINVEKVYKWYGKKWTYGPYGWGKYWGKFTKYRFDGCEAGGVNAAAGSIYTGLRNGSCERDYKITFKPYKLVYGPASIGN